VASNRRIKKQVDAWARWCSREPIASSRAPAGMHRAYAHYRQSLRRKQNIYIPRYATEL